MIPFQTLRLPLVAATAALAGFGFAAPALAHANLQSETPAANTKVAAPPDLQTKDDPDAWTASGSEVYSSGVEPRSRSS